MTIALKKPRSKNLLPLEAKINTSVNYKEAFLEMYNSFKPGMAVRIVENKSPRYDSTYMIDAGKIVGVYDGHITIEKPGTTYKESVSKNALYCKSVKLEIMG